MLSSPLISAMEVGGKDMQPVMDDCPQVGSQRRQVLAISFPGSIPTL